MINDHSYGSSHYIYINVDTSIDKFDWKLKKNHFINFINFINFPLLVLLLLFVIQPIEFCIVSYSQKQESNNTVPWSTILSHNYPPTPSPSCHPSTHHWYLWSKECSLYYTSRNRKQFCFSQFACSWPKPPPVDPRTRQATQTQLNKQKINGANNGQPTTTKKTDNHNNKLAHSHTPTQGKKKRWLFLQQQRGQQLIITTNLFHHHQQQLQLY